MKRFASAVSLSARFLGLAMLVGIAGWTPLGGVPLACAWAQSPSESVGESSSASTETSTTGDTTAARNSAGASNSGQRTLLQSLMDSGICGLLIFLLSVVAVAFMVEHSMTIRKGVLMPEDVVEELDQLIRDGRTEEALTLCQDPRCSCLFSEVVLAGLERFLGSEFGFAEYRAAAEEAGEDQTARLYRKTEVLGVIGAIAPMLGLLGTVMGMIKSFNTIASTRGMARPDQLASGISEALVTTLMGLVVAIPAMVAYSYFRNKIDSLVAEAGKRVEQVLMPLGRRR